MPAVAELPAVEEAAVEAPVESTMASEPEQMPVTEMLSLDDFVVEDTGDVGGFTFDESIPDATSMVSETVLAQEAVSEAEDVAIEPAPLEHTEAELEAEAIADLPVAVAAPAEAEAALPSVDADDALAAMIAAFGSEPAPSATAAPIAEPVFDEAALEAPAAFADATLSAADEALAEVPATDVAEPVAEAAASVEAPAAAREDFYGLSMEELEALTAPAADSETPVDADVPVAADLTPAGSISTDVEVAAVTEEESLPSADSAEAVEAFEPVSEAAAIESGVAEEPAIEQAQETEATQAEETFVEAAQAEAVQLEEAPATEVAQVDEAFAEAAQAEEAVPAEPVAAVEEMLAAVATAPRVMVPMAMDPDDPDEALDTSDLDTDLLDIFLEESTDILDHSDGMLAKLRDDASDRELVTGLQRDLHTLKGGARMAGIFAVGELGHSMESLLEAVAEGRRSLDESGIVVLERGFDRLHAMVGRIGERKAIALPAGLIAQVEALAEGRALDAVAETAPESAEAAAETGTATPAAVETPAAPVLAAEKPAPVAPAAPALKPLSAPVDALADEDDLSSVRAPQEQVRIRADLLDRLVNYAGEVAIYRARLEQQLGAFRANLGELNQTTDRLREQLRRLDIETEAQIVARYQREDEASDETFDPLELDRFTTQQQLSRSLAESANDLVNLQTVLDDLTRQYETLLLQQSRVSSDLQEGLMRTRMVPFDALVPRLRRVLRQAASDTGKQVQLKVDGASGEMDRNVLDRMTAPLEHMLRNAMAHGLETPADRRASGKPEEGSVRIAVSREGSEVVLKVSDDGRGLNKEAIRSKALERGLIAADADLADEALYALILETGFSTAETVSRLAGRGVGMDVVYSEIRQLGGSLQIRSEAGKGSEFIIRLPFTLAVTQAVFVKIGDTSFAVPIASVQGVGRIARGELDKQLAGDKPVFMYAGEEYGIHDLGHLIGHAGAKAQDSLQMPLLLARSGDLRAAICVDQVLGSREIVVKPVGPQVNSVPGIFGATIMGDGRVVVILDVAPLVRRHAATVLQQHTTPAVPAPAAVVHRVPVVMVVDDSITMRKVTGRVLERHNMEVLTAKDGVDAVEKMAERVPDLVLLDIEMPRMDGYEVAQNMRSDPRLKDVPIIMITSRTGEKHRQRAMDIGVNRYLGKPYQEPELMRNVFEMLGLESVNG
jgi:chemosensory pili system protein ChpA (sensor histidine kinase/response regulator)